MSQLSKREGLAYLQSDIPEEVRHARAVNWEEIVDAYLVGAASVGRCYAATAFFDRSGWISDGMTVVTPFVSRVTERDGCLLFEGAAGITTSSALTARMFAGDYGEH